MAMLSGPDHAMTLSLLKEHHLDVYNQRNSIQRTGALHQNPLPVQLENY